MGNVAAYLPSVPVDYQEDHEHEGPCKYCKDSSLFAVREFLFLLEHLHDYQKKVRVIEDVLRYIQKNPYLITYHFRFRETIRKKTLEFIAKDNTGLTHVFDPLYEDLFGLTPDYERAIEKRSVGGECFCNCE